MNEEEEMKTLAAQLRQPYGEEGIKLADQMFASNRAMIWAAIEAFHFNGGDKLLEIGMGSGLHIPELFARCPQLSYTGIDTSELMVKESAQNNEALQGMVQFMITDGLNLPFDNQCFDKILTVNTIYFWQQPKVFLAEISRVLKPGGILSLALAHKNFMKQLPFTQYGFTLYDVEDLQKLFATSHLQIESIVHHSDEALSKTGSKVKRDFLIVRASY